MKKILLIGGNGLIGKSIYKYFSKKNQIKILDLSGDPKKILKADISNKVEVHNILNKYLSTKKIDTVINAAYPRIISSDSKDPLKSDSNIILKNYKHHYIGYFIITQFLWELAQLFST